MEKPNNLTESLLRPSVNPSLGRNQKAVVMRKRFRRSRSAPLIDYAPEAISGDDPPSSDARFRMHPSLKKVAALLSIYLGVGLICFCLFRRQIDGKKTSDIVDAFYFCVVTMTTVGYGDLFPESVPAKLFACAFVFSGMALVGLILSEAADYLVEKQEVLFVKALHSYKKHGPRDFMNEIEMSNLGYKCLFVCAVLLVLIVIGTVFLALVERLDFIDSFYCVVATITTLGYGDRSFSTKGGRIFAVLWILLSTVCLGQFFLYVAEMYTERRQNSLVHFVLSRHVTNRDLEAADIDNDGDVEVAEFVLYKLKEMGKITQQDISLVMKEFEELDFDQSGTLSLADITLAQSPPPER
uniref:Potassium channel domain-containing protein n=1 Tax=Opuntia streptacantha TaxID=393608 RepID=A0A7C9CKY0_OPUST